MATAPPQQCPGHSGGRCWGPRGPSLRPQWPRTQYTELFLMPQQSTMLRIISKICGGRGRAVSSQRPLGRVWAGDPLPDPVGRGWGPQGPAQSARGDPQQSQPAHSP